MTSWKQPCVRPAPEAHGSPVRNDKALRPDTSRRPSRAGGVRVESEACLDAVEHDGNSPPAYEKEYGIGAVHGDSGADYGLFARRRSAQVNERANAQDWLSLVQHLALLLAAPPRVERAPCACAQQAPGGERTSRRGARGSCSFGM